MEWKDYIKTVVKRESNDFVKIKASLSVDRNIRLLHAAMGLCTEYGEYRSAVRDNNVVNTKEELGDMFWYLGLACDVVCNDNPLYMPWCKDLYYSCSEFLDIVKKNIFYDKPIDYNDLEYCLNSIYSCLINGCDSLGVKYEDILVLNDNKLEKRYQDKFSKEKALNRDTDKELEDF